MTAVRLLRVPLTADCSPQAALRALASDPWPFALTGRWAGGGAILGSDPLRLAGPGEDPFALLDELPAVDGADACEDAVGGGWFGWLGAGLAGRVERLAPPPPRPVPLPAFQLAYYDHVLRLDGDGRWWFEALATPQREAPLRRRLALLRARLAATPPLAPDGAVAPSEPFRIAGGRGLAHVAAVAECVERIAAGEIFQANVCLRFETRWEGDVGALFAQASAALRPAYGAAFPTPWGGVASLSPELFLRRRGRAVETAPIKGTIARTGADGDPAAAAARAALAGSAKDHAEHVMIVDLMRNDLGRVCAYGSIEAERTPEAQAHPGLWHLVTRVRGTLRPEVGDGELLRATFPPGSVTGAPKVQALHVIGELEGSARELYTGAVGYASPLAGLELNVAIRTFEARDGRLWLGAGGGIVADSKPWAELEECHVKARPLVAAIGGTIAPATAPGPSLPHAPPATAPAPSLPHAPAPAAVPPTARAAGAPAPAAAAASLPRALASGRRRPDPARGVFETLLVCDGVALRAAAHLARLAASAAALFDLPLPGDLAERVATAAAGAGAAPCRLRVSAQPGDGRLAVDLQLGSLPQRALPVLLAPVMLPGGLGAHKWLDRDLLDALAGAGSPLPPSATPLLLDGDGGVLEAAWGSLVLLEGQRLVTPPADGRILPGVTRAALLAHAAQAGLTVVEEPVDLARAAAADGLVLSSALALAVPARLAGSGTGVGAAAASGGAADGLASRLRALLRGTVEAAV
jgi:para-aminobenzoate synthetase / 4-amino-4-deoxychorismate lyase